MKLGIQHDWLTLLLEYKSKKKGYVGLHASFFPSNFQQNQNGKHKF